MANILIADSGSTKTDWRLVTENGQVQSIVTQGINPYYQSHADIVQTLKKELFPAMNSPLVRSVYFYGAGCSSLEKQQKIASSLKQVFGNEIIAEVQHDMLAAARALCGRTAGIACILGTGSNSCVYDGAHIVVNGLGLGFLLGDEGAGSRMGIRLLQDYFYHEMPAFLRCQLEEKRQISRETVLENLYQKSFPNRYAASFSPFLADNLQDDYCYGVVYKELELFFQKCVCKYDGFADLPVHFTGSIAYHYADVLRKVAQDLPHEINIGNILQTPMDGLLQYHGVKI
jgi:glucosamine kinase